MTKVSDLKWWQRAVFYQVYPRSFADGNGDGIGDLPGIIARLDYLRDLGIDAVWLSPHYPSPLIDCGYDVADYTAVASEYGTLDDFRRFLDGTHARGIRVILDFVLNHTSDRHAWFQAARSRRDDPRHDWYVWHDPVDGGPPNNWESSFGGSAWEWVPEVGQYYYHFFFKEQPDLNWRNPAVVAAMHDAMRFWLDMGVDGFRLDAIGTIFEDPALPDHTSPYTLPDLIRRNFEGQGSEPSVWFMADWKRLFAHQVDQPGLHEITRGLRRVVDEYDDRVLVGETEEISYLGDGTDELHMVFNFPLMQTDRLTPEWIRANQTERLAALPPAAWPCNTLGNHDVGRAWSHFADGRHDAELARLSLALMLTLRGTPFLYYGEEIGMTDLLLGDVDLFRDTLGIQFYRLGVEEFGMPPDLMLSLAARESRDRARTPMQWANAPNGGFSPNGVSTWLPVNPNYARGVNATEQARDDASLLQFYRSLLALRRGTPALIAGDYTVVDCDATGCFVFLRQAPHDGQTCLVVLNFSGDAHVLRDGLGGRALHRLFSSVARAGVHDDPAALAIAPFEVYIGEVA